jgi:hypothetical protein
MGRMRVKLLRRNAALEEAAFRIARRHRATLRDAEITVDEGRTGVPRPT